MTHDFHTRSRERKEFYIYIPNSLCCGISGMHGWGGVSAAFPASFVGKTFQRCDSEWAIGPDSIIIITIRHRGQQVREQASIE
jgi:hypothetical protein